MALNASDGGLFSFFMLCPPIKVLDFVSMKELYVSLDGKSINKRRKRKM